MRKIYSLLCLLFLLVTGLNETQAVTLTLDQILTADQIVAGKKIVLRGLKNGNPWINILENNEMTVSKASVFIVEDAEGGVYLKNESTGLYLKAYQNGVSTIASTESQADAGVFEVSNPIFKEETDMNWLDPEKDHTLLTRFTSKGTNMFINTQSASAKAIYASGTGGWSIMYVYDVTDVDWDAVEPEPESPLKPVTDGVFSEDKYYAVNRMNMDGAFMVENNAGQLYTTTFQNKERVFWKLIPTGKENCYYVQNATTGRYVQSTKQNASAQIPMGSNPVEFQIGKDTKSGSSTNGASFYYFCSTDQSNIPSGALGLNLNGGKPEANVVAWSAASGSQNSYWTVSETEYTYEPEIVPIVDSFDKIVSANKSSLVASDGKWVAAENGTIVLAERGSENKFAWVFVGTSNKTEGLYLVNMAEPTKALTLDAEGNYTFAEPENATRWYVSEKDINGVSRLVFVPFDQKDETDAPYLTVGGASDFALGNYRSTYSLMAQVYTLPCGMLDNGYLTALDITGEQVQKELNYAATAKPTEYYTLYTTEKATVSVGQKFKLSATVAQMDENVTMYVYFDWNRDGMFETMYTYNSADVAEEISVPEDAVVGKSRMRVRITNNALTDAEDDAVGSIYDFIVNIAEPQAKRTVTVAPNDPERGVTEIQIGEETAQSYTCDYGQELTVLATPNNKLEFIAWKDNRTVVSTEKEYNFTVTENADLVACFSPNSTLATDIQDANVDQNNFVYEIQQGDQNIQVITDAEVKMVYIFAIDGTQVRKAAGKNISVAGLSQGTYIVKVVTAVGDGSKKVSLK